MQGWECCRYHTAADCCLLLAGMRHQEEECWMCSRALLNDEQLFPFNTCSHEPPCSTPPRQESREEPGSPVLGCRGGIQRALRAGLLMTPG